MKRLTRRHLQKTSGLVKPGLSASVDSPAPAGGGRADQHRLAACRRAEHPLLTLLARARSPAARAHLPSRRALSVEDRVRRRACEGAVGSRTTGTGPTSIARTAAWRSARP